MLDKHGDVLICDSDSMERKDNSQPLTLSNHFAIRCTCISISKQNFKDNVLRNSS